MTWLLQCRPDILASQAGVTGTKAAENLARADRIPSPIIGPQYAMDEAGIQYIGLVYITPVPIWNNGKPLVHQRQADHQRSHMALEQARQRPWPRCVQPSPSGMGLRNSSRRPGD